MMKRFCHFSLFACVLLFLGGRGYSADALSDDQKALLTVIYDCVKIGGDSQQADSPDASLFGKMDCKSATERALDAKIPKKNIAIAILNARCNLGTNPEEEKKKCESLLPDITSQIDREEARIYLRRCGGCGSAVRKAKRAGIGQEEIDTFTKKESAPEWNPDLP